MHPWSGRPVPERPPEPRPEPRPGPRPERRPERRSEPLTRLVLVGSVLVDLVLYVPQLPPLGGDVLADDTLLSAGGGYNVMSAASRQGLPAAYAGRHGTGRFGDQIRADLRADQIELLLPQTLDGDSGFCVGLVDATGERTYITREGVDGHLTTAELAGLRVQGSDAVYLSGYDLAYEHGPVVCEAFTRTDDAGLTIFDPGPLVADLPPDLRDAVLDHTDWVSLNAREAALLTGIDDPASSAQKLSRRVRRGSIVRAGSDGCWLALDAANGEPLQLPVPGGPVTPVDTAGAGDTHVGTFVAALGRGLSAEAACRWANSAAARCVTRKGPATGPILAVTQQDIEADAS
jgi:sugar/nucleoside kinase (ribokinase family)